MTIHARVDLLPLDSAQMVPGEVQWHLATFGTQGYEPLGGGYFVPQLEIALWPAFHRDGTFVVIYHHAGIAGTWFDLIHMKDPGHWLTASNSPSHNPQHTPPGCEMLHRRDWKAETAIDALHQAAKTTAMAVDAATFLDRFKSSYEASIAWITGRAIQTDDVERIAQDFNHGPVSAERLERARLKSEQDRRLAREEVLLTPWQEQGMTAVVIFPDTTRAQARRKLGLLLPAGERARQWGRSFLEPARSVDDPWLREQARMAGALVLAHWPAGEQEEAWILGASPK